MLLEDKAADDAHRRQQEAAAKAQASELAKKIKLMKIDGYQTWLSWSYQAYQA